MSRPLRITGLILASLTIVTVALAQQSSGQGRSDAPPQAAVMTAGDPGKARLSRAAQPRLVLTDYPAHACDTPPKINLSAQADAAAQQSCGGDGTVARDRNGKVIRRICRVL